MSEFRKWVGRKLGYELVREAEVAAENAKLAHAWDEGVVTALNHAILNPDQITLRLEHLDGRPWQNPYRREHA